MKNNIVALVILFISAVGFSQNKVEKCTKLQNEEQKVCKDHLISNMVSSLAEYPESALNKELEGTVYVRFSVDENQTLNSLRILGESDQVMADAAKKAIQKFVESDGKMLLANSEVYRIPVRFELK